jgi:hypothetical protein
MSADGFVCFDMTGLDPIDNGFGRHVAELTGLENGQYVFHRNAPFRLVVVKKTFRYSNVFSTTVHPLMPQFRISEHYYGKRQITVITVFLINIVLLFCQVFFLF